MGESLGEDGGQIYEELVDAGDAANFLLALGTNQDVIAHALVAGGSQDDRVVERWWQCPQDEYA